MTKAELNDRCREIAKELQAILLDGPLNGVKIIVTRNSIVVGVSEDAKPKPPAPQPAPAAPEPT